MLVIKPYKIIKSKQKTTKTALAIRFDPNRTFLQDLDTKHQTLEIDTPIYSTMEMSYAIYNVSEGAVASWLVHSSPHRALRVRALAGDISCVVF